MPRKMILVGLVAILLFGAFPAFGERPPQAPDLAVGIIPFTRTEAVLNCHVEQLINNLLDIHGVRVTLIDASIEVPAAFTAHPNLDFVVTGALTAGETPTVFAKVFARGNTSPRTEDGACDAIAASVARKLTDNHAAGEVLATREASAKTRLGSDPDDFHSLMTLGLLNIYKGRWDEAFPFIEHAVKIKPDDLQAQLNLALCYKQRNDHENWLLHLTNAEKINPDEDGVLIALGNYYADTGDQQRAVSYYERAEKFGLNNDVAHWNLAVVYSKMQNVDQALTNLEAIPTTSLYYTEAQPWAAQLTEGKRLGDIAKQKEAAPRKSVWALLGLPEQVAILFVGVALVLCLVPYFGGKKFYNFDVPPAPPRLRGALKLLGPVAFLAVIAMFPPVWRDTTAAIQNSPPSASPSVIEASRSTSSAKYLR
ncbi:MAG TPA: tetratricopeptide repeat protein [Terriglobia bacterium]|nr:tetratricopeptide repeat protein [Terriglobia bacterium]